MRGDNRQRIVRWRSTADLADVVRYIGLEKLMKMRDQAKEGLARMEEIGQVGNADEVSNADALHGEAADEEDEDEGGDNNYASGGYVGGTVNAEKYKRAPIKGFEMVQMTDDKGNTIYIPHINGRPQLQVPVGYKPVVNTATTVSFALTYLDLLSLLFGLRACIFKVSRIKPVSIRANVFAVCNAGFIATRTAVVNIFFSSLSPKSFLISFNKSSSSLPPSNP